MNKWRNFDGIAGRSVSSAKAFAHLSSNPPGHFFFSRGQN